MMELPVGLSDDFLPLKKKQTVEEALLWLKKSTEKDPEGIIRFFEAACHDRIWAKENMEWIGALFSFFNETFCLGSLLPERAARVAACVREPDAFFYGCIPQELTIKVQSQEFKGNTLLLLTVSPLLLAIYNSIPSQKENKILLLKGLASSFSQVLEYANTGCVKDLWKKDYQELFAFMHEAADWGVEGLVDSCAHQLKRYFNPTNTVKYLLIAHLNGWGVLRQLCYDYYNALECGIRFLPTSADLFVVEFLDYRQEGIDLFESVKEEVTGLKFNGIMVEDPRFSQLVYALPHLSAVDLSAVRVYHERILDLPSSIEEIDLSSSDWVSDARLEEMIAHFPRLKKINLSSTSTLTYRGWSALHQLPRLTQLSLARCHRLSDDDLKIICRSAPQLEELTLEACTRLTDEGMGEIAKTLTRLTTLILSDTSLSNTGLVELLTRCRALETVVCKECPLLTKAGLIHLQSLHPTISLVT